MGMGVGTGMDTDTDTPVARRNESCEARANEAPAKAADSRLIKPPKIITSQCHLRHSYRSASRVRSAYAALRVPISSAVIPINTEQLHIPVARRNESCEGRANEAPAKAADSRLIQPP